MAQTQKWIIVSVIVLCFTCCCAAFCLGGALFFIQNENPVNILPEASSWPYEGAIDNPPAWPPMAVPFDLEGLTPASQDARQTLQTLEGQIVPSNDPRKLAQRLLGKHSIPETMPEAVSVYKVGDKKTFWASNTDSNESYEVNASLRHRSAKVPTSKTTAAAGNLKVSCVFKTDYPKNSGCP